ncbi:MAG: nucleotide exchange factor GrpE [Planctomycetaceae bacterium]|jgi:molecular chaperone GrpE|nr:nucleotide exchange factor GrpE [Planctomycetaceae bacterium]
MSEEHIDIVCDPESEQTAGEPVSEAEQLRLEIEEAKNRTLRAMADLENYRSRTNRQMLEERKYANIDLMRELLPVWDNIGRALEAVAASHNLESLVEGVQMVHQQLLDVFKKFHCEKIEAKFQPFDPNFHASVAQMPSQEHPANTVIEEVQAGFRLHDRVVRPSQVVLSKKAEQSAVPDA